MTSRIPRWVFGDSSTFGPRSLDPLCRKRSSSVSIGARAGRSGDRPPARRGEKPRESSEFSFTPKKGLRASSSSSAAGKEKILRKLNVADAHLARLRRKCFRAPRSSIDLKLLLRGRADRKPFSRVPESLDPTHQKVSVPLSHVSRPQAFRQQLFFHLSRLFFSSADLAAFRPLSVRK